MKITVKTLQQKTFPLEVSEDETVLAVKQRIESDQQHPVAQQKLIFSGKILDDGKQLKEYALKEGDFLVLMVTKPAKVTTPAAASTPAPAKASSSTAASSSAAKPAETKTPVKAPEAKKEEEKPKTATPAAATAAPASTAAAPTASGASAFVAGPQYEQAVTNLMEMGFERDQIVKAMRAAFNNPDRAVEYLMTGIPEMETEAPQAAPAAAAAAAAAAPAPVDQPDVVGETDDEHAAGEGVFQELRNHPQFQQMMQLIQTQPQLLEPLLQTIGQSNPQLLQAINENPQAFMQWLAEEMGGGMEGDDDIPPGAQVIELTQEEREAVERLTALGFDRMAAVEAYLLCDKNEMLAANYLFDNAGNMGGDA